MPRHQILSDLERKNIFEIPEDKDELIRLYTLSERDISLIMQYSRGIENRLGFAIQLCYMRFPGIILPPTEPPSLLMLNFIGAQLNIYPQVWNNYSQRAETRREHILSLQSILDVEVFTTVNHYELAVKSLSAIALQTDKGIVLARELTRQLRNKKILLPAIFTIETICAEAITQASRSIYQTLTESLSDEQKTRLDSLLLLRDGTALSTLLWLRQSPASSRRRPSGPAPGCPTPTRSRRSWPAPITSTCSVSASTCAWTARRTRSTKSTPCPSRGGRTIPTGTRSLPAPPCWKPRPRPSGWRRPG